MKLKKISLYGMGILYTLAGILHFINPEFYMKIMPPYLPFHLALVYLSGVAETMLGILLFIPKYKTIAAYGIIALLIAVFPANIYQLTSALEGSVELRVPIWTLFLRLPIQFLLMYWAYTVAKQKD
jgi:uncharacterized membrane protein